MEWLTILRALAPRGNPAMLQGTADAMPEMVSRFALTTSLRQAHFLGQCAHESAGFTTVIEIGSTRYFARYDGRKDLGNTRPGDGARFRGRGLIQLTGRRNYQRFGEMLGVDLEGYPEKAARFPIAAQTAGYFWRLHGLNAAADRDDIVAITRAINGGTNGLASRKAFVARAKTCLSAHAQGAPIVSDPPLIQHERWTMNQEQVFSLIRQVFLTAGGGLVTDGYLTESAETAIVGGLVAVLASAWALYTRRTSGLVAAASAQPEVAKIVATHAIANGTLADDPKVVAS